MLGGVKDRCLVGSGNETKSKFNRNLTNLFFASP